MKTLLNIVGRLFSGAAFSRTSPRPSPLPLAAEREQQADVFRQANASLANPALDFSKTRRTFLPLRSLGGKGEGRGEVRVGFALTLILALTTLVSTAQAKLNIVVTTPDLAAIAKEVGGDKVEITTLARPTEDPHFVDAKPSFIVKLNRADAIVEGGAELEVGWLPPLLNGARNVKLAPGAPGYIRCNEGIHMLEVPATLDRSQGDVHAAGNPHFMPDPLNGKIVAEHLANAFCELDPKSCDTFKANLKNFEEHLDAKMSEWQKLLAPYKGKHVISYHNYWIYFANRFDLKMELFLEPKPGIPPTPAHLAEVISKMKSDNLKLIVVQPYQNRKTAETVAGHTGGTVLDWPSFPMTSKETQSYIDWIDYLVKSLAKGFEDKK